MLQVVTFVNLWVPPSPQGDNPPGLTPLWTGGGLNPTQDLFQGLSNGIMENGL